VLRAVKAKEDVAAGGHFCRVASPPPHSPLQPKSYIATAMSYAANLLWIALGSGFLAIGCSSIRDGYRKNGAFVAAVGIIALAAGAIL